MVWNVGEISNIVFCQKSPILYIQSYQYFNYEMEESKCSARAVSQSAKASGWTLTKEIILPLVCLFKIFRFSEGTFITFLRSDPRHQAGVCSREREREDWPVSSVSAVFAGFRWIQMDSRIISIYIELLKYPALYLLASHKFAMINDLPYTAYWEHK